MRYERSHVKGPQARSHRSRTQEHWLDNTGELEFLEHHCWGSDSLYCVFVDHDLMENRAVDSQTLHV